MHVRVYVTDDGTQSGTAPIAFVNGRRSEIIPKHPESLRWRYWGIVNDEDRLLNTDGNLARRSIQLHGFYISQQGVEESGPRR